MTKRFTLIECNGNIEDEYTQIVYYGGEDVFELLDLLNSLDDENEQLKKELDYIQNSITEHIKHQKTELGQKALKEVIEDYNEWLLGHKELEE